MLSTVVAFFLLPLAPNGQWGPSALPLSALAAKTDASLAKLSKAKLTYRYSYVRAAIGSGFVDCESIVISPTLFRIEIPNVGEDRKNVLEKEIWLSDGKHFGLASGGELPSPGPLASRPGGNPRPASVWFTDFSRVLMSGVGQSTHPVQRLVESGKRQGFAVSTGYRELRLQAGTVASYRIDLAKGGARYELVVDARNFLPVSVTNFLGKNDNTRWTGLRWAFAKKPISPSIVAFHPRSKTTILGPRPLRP